MSGDQEGIEPRGGPGAGAGADKADVVRLLQSGAVSEAAALCERLCRNAPDDGECWYLRGDAQAAAGELEAAVHAYVRALHLAPRHMAAAQLLKQGQRLLQLLPPDAAATLFDAFCQARPGEPEAWFLASSAAGRRGDMGAAAEYARQALVLDQDHTSATMNLAKALAALGRHAEAVPWFRGLLRRYPDVAEIHAGLGAALIDTQDYAEAEYHLARALALVPEAPSVHREVGRLRFAQGRLVETEHHYRRVIQLQPGQVSGLANLAFVLYAAGQPAGAVEALQQALVMDPSHTAVASALLSTLHCLPGYSPGELLNETRRRWPVAVSACDGRAAGGVHANPPQPRRRLRVGYVSGDFHSHPVAFFLEPVLAHRDRAGFEVFCYYNDTVDDEQTQRLRSYSDHWCNVRTLSNAALADRIRADGIDILVDLAGHTANNCLPAFSLRPAPVQMTWLGYFGTTAVPGVDYIIGDRHVIPPGGEGHYTERVLRLPHCYCCFAKPDNDLQVLPPPDETAGELVLGGFHKPAKLTAPVIALWSRLLHALPQARLYLKYRWLDDAGVSGRLLTAFAGHGIGPERLRIEGPAARQELLAAYGGVDVALDTFPYNGGTTTVEALWMGVPVVTLRGDRFVHRVGASILSTAGLDELIADSEDDYVAKVVALAADGPRRRALRQTQRARLLASPLFDGERFARDLEGLYRDAWKAWCRGVSN